MAAINVSTTAVRLDVDTASKPHPCYFMLYNEGPGNLYLGDTSAVTAADGMTMPVGSFVSADLYDSGLYAISASGTNVARTLQIKARP